MIDYDEWLMSGYDPEYDDDYDDELSVGDLLSELFREGMKDEGAAMSMNAREAARFAERED